MPIHSVPVTMRNGESVSLRRDGTRWVCPVCGAWLDRAPYNPDSGDPSRDWCASCETQFGWDDIIPPDAPPGTQAAKWRELREDWRSERSMNDTLTDQLARLELPETKEA